MAEIDMIRPVTTGMSETHTSSLLLDGSWLPPAPATIDVIAPATGRVHATIDSATREHVQEAVAAADRDDAGWRTASGLERCEILGAVAARLTERESQIARTLAIETGKPLAEAVAEIRLSAGYFRWFAHEALRSERVTTVRGRREGDQLVVRKPVPVAAVLTPWNFPVSIQARKLAAALAAGCSVVSRPSSEAPLAVVELFRCLEASGLPAGAANLLTGDAAAIADALLRDPRVRVVSFTGSTEVGKALFEASASTIKRLALELGGSAPFVVLEDADLDSTLDQAMLAKFRNGGQSCVAANCFYVEDSLYEPFVAGLGSRVEQLRLGDPLDPATTLGPLINPARRAALEAHIDHATASGFAPVAQSRGLPKDADLSPASFLPATVLACDDADALDPVVDATEVFGPVAQIVRFTDRERLVRRLARHRLGLAGYVFSEDRAEALDLAARLEVGIAGVNQGLATAVNVPMGGVKESGIGREGGADGMHEFVDTQYIALRGPLIRTGGSAGHVG